jgi:GT2 family glycosyltransferase
MAKIKKPSVLIGMNSFNDLHFLRESMPALDQLAQVLDAHTVVMDTARNDEVREFFEEEFPQFEFVRHKEGNIGYGRSFSEILRANPGYDYFVVVTSDVFLDAAVVKKFIEKMEKDESLAMCAGKMHYWDIEAGRKTNVIDTVGIMAERRHHFYDCGCGEEDKGQYDDRLGEMFGISGAAFVIRVEAVKELHGKPWQIFDPRMWMYKEDVDLAYRMRWLGAGVKIFPEVWGWHARTVANKLGQDMGELRRSDKGKRDYARMNSYKNHMILLKNNFSWRYGFGVVSRVLWYEFLKGVYMLVMHPRVFLTGVKNLLFVSGRRSVRRVSVKEMSSYFN